jgi:hypothetical protein
VWTQDTFLCCLKKNNKMLHAFLRRKIGLPFTQVHTSSPFTTIRSDFHPPVFEATTCLGDCSGTSAQAQGYLGWWVNLQIPAKLG